MITQASGDIVENIGLGGIAVTTAERLRALRPDIVKALMKSMRAEGLRRPILLRPRPDHGYWLVAGCHRLEAARKLKWEGIPAIILEDMDDEQAEVVANKDNESDAGAEMKKDDGVFTKIAGKLLSDVRDLVDWGIEGGHTTQEKLRLTVTARRIEAAKLIEAGLSQRQAAMVLGVSAATINHDVQKGNENRSEPEHQTKADRRAERERELASKQTALPSRHYGVIVADPEWRFEPYSRDSGMDRAADNHYPTSVTEVIAERDVASIAADDCVLFLWATVPMLRDALHVMEAWGFEYKSHAVWDKVHIGTGYWFRNRHELLLVGTKGDIPAPAMGDQFASVMTIARKEHSAKPEQFLELIEQYFPNLPKIELNRRGPARPGWDAWGLEAEAAE
jgi:N6-adenosine-specific RNA methylase IME4/ParB-like chromosome segregation protein Spo0J